MSSALVADTHATLWYLTNDARLSVDAHREMENAAQASLPVYKLIGGKVHERIPAYANGWYTGERTPEAFTTPCPCGIICGGGTNPCQQSDLSH